MNMESNMPDIADGTSVALIAYNRPEPLRRVVAAIAAAAPPRLYVIADGSRPNDPQDSEAVRAARSVIEDVDWKSDVTWIASDVNLGCRTRVQTGLDRVFQEEDRLIIVEDDCVPEQSFFAFCNEMLEKFSNDDRVASVCGSNMFFGFPSRQRYVFSRYPFVWGWATWRRAWESAAVSSVDLNTIRRQLDGDPMWGRDHIDRKLDAIQRGDLDTWDYVWLATNLVTSRRHLISSRNMISNVGFGDDATHTRRRTYARALPTSPDVPGLHGPDDVVVGSFRDRWLSLLLFNDSVVVKVLTRAIAWFVRGIDFLWRQIGDRVESWQGER